MSALAAQRTNTAFTLYEALLRVIDPEASDDLGDLALEGLLDSSQPGYEAELGQKLLGGQEPAEPEQDLWVQGRMRCVPD